MNRAPDAIEPARIWVKDSERVRRRAPAWVRRVNGALVTAAFVLIVVWTAGAYGRSPLYAFGINWLLMMWAIALAQFVPLRLPARYSRVRPFEQGGRLYDRIGVRWYRRWFRPVLWTIDPAQLRSPGAREYMIDAAQGAEVGHLLVLAAIAGITGWAAARGWWDAVPWLLVFNVVHNGYPVLSMRQLRARLERRAGVRRRTRITPAHAR